MCLDNCEGRILIKIRDLVYLQLDFHGFFIKFLLETDLFGALGVWGSIFIDFLLISYEKPIILGPSLAGVRFSLIFRQILIRKRSFWGSGQPGLDFH